MVSRRDFIAMSLGAGLAASTANAGLESKFETDKIPDGQFFVQVPNKQSFGDELPEGAQPFKRFRKVLKDKNKKNPLYVNPEHFDMTSDILKGSPSQLLSLAGLSDRYFVNVVEMAPFANSTLIASGDIEAIYTVTNMPVNLDMVSTRHNINHMTRRLGERVISHVGLTTTLRPKAVSEDESTYLSVVKDIDGVDAIAVKRAAYALLTNALVGGEAAAVNLGLGLLNNLRKYATNVFKEEKRFSEFEGVPIQGKYMSDLTGDTPVPLADIANEFPNWVGNSRGANVIPIHQQIQGVPNYSTLEGALVLVTRPTRNGFTTLGDYGVQGYNLLMPDIYKKQDGPQPAYQLGLLERREGLADYDFLAELLVYGLTLNAAKKHLKNGGGPTGIGGGRDAGAGAGFIPNP